ncbi:MAG: RiPP maturation radical SAM C-methyltransferase [Calothrix sp. MO_192.B10]|nr:RiPP maturation radical SAM C-methyltransferase [Calothrix sp. MO_192.B10]
MTKSFLKINNSFNGTTNDRVPLSVALVSMPFASTKRPSIQLGLLKSIAVSYGFPTKTFHLNLDFAAQIGLTLYERLCFDRQDLLGDWLFSIAAFGAEAPDPDDIFLKDFHPAVKSLLADLNLTTEDLSQLRHIEILSYLDRLIETIPWEQFQAVGFTSTFQQNAAAFALAKRIKNKYSHITTFFGGANFEGEMGQELVRSVECIDYALIGEGDQTLPEFLAALQEQREPAEVPGVVCRRNGKVTPLRSRPPFETMNELPTPDYDEFFERAEALGIISETAPKIIYIPFESSRGCWWGQNNQCTFCGLNGMNMSYRAKSPQRVLSELVELCHRYGSFYFEAVDNVLDWSYLKNFFAHLTESGTDYKFFYEVRSNLSREKMKTLAEGGVWRIQPGIESLSTPVLKLMRKGVKAIQNVNTLRWAAYYNVSVAWNLLWGFPNEAEKDYQEQLTLLRQIIHLEPPYGTGRIRMERFSPLFHERQTYPVRYIIPEASYAYVYPKHIQLDKVAYFFEYELENTLPESVYAETKKQVEVWQTAWRNKIRPSLIFWSAPGFIQIEDMRCPDKCVTHTFDDPLASLYVACSSKPQSVEGLKQNLGLSWSENEIESALHEFCTRKIMMQEDKTFLSLALPASRGERIPFSHVRYFNPHAAD